MSTDAPNSMVVMQCSSDQESRRGRVMDVFPWAFHRARSFPTTTFNVSASR